METRSLGLLLHDAARAVRKRFEARSSSYGLTSAQWRLLVWLCKTEGGAPQSRFADLLEIEPISVSRLLDRMEALGWVTRAPDPSDRRVRRVFPTQQARDVFANFKPIADQVYAEALAGISPEQHRVLMESLAQVISNLATAEEIGQKEPS